MVLDLAVFDRILQEEIVDRFDHRHINDAAEQFGSGQDIPTSEMLAIFFFNRIAARLPDGVTLKGVRVEETPGFFAEYFGEE